MAHAIHHTTALTMLHSGGPIDLSFWKKSGEIVHLRNCIALPNKAAARYSGTQNFKVLSSGQFSCKRAQSRAMPSAAENALTKSAKSASSAFSASTASKFSSKTTL